MRRSQTVAIICVTCCLLAVAATLALRARWPAISGVVTACLVTIEMGWAIFGYVVTRKRDGNV